MVKTTELPPDEREEIHIWEDQRYESFLGQGMSPVEASNKLILESGYGGDDDYVSEDIAERLSEKNNFNTYQNMEEAKLHELPNQGVYISKPMTHMDQYGVFQNVPDRPLNFLEGLKQSGRMEDWWDTQNGRQLASDLQMFQDSIAEASAVGLVDGIKGLLSIPFLVGAYFPPGEAMWRMIFDLGAVEHDPEKQFTGVSKELSAEMAAFKNKGQPYGGTEFYFKQADESRSMQIVKMIDKHFEPLREMITKSVGSPAEDWARTLSGRVIRLAAEMFPPDVLINKAIKHRKAIANPFQILGRFAYGQDSMAISQALSRAAHKTERAERHALNKDVHNIQIADSAVGGALFYETAKNIAGHDNPYSELIAMPLLVAGAILTPSAILSKGQRLLYPLTKKSWYNNQVRFMSFFYKRQANRAIKNNDAEAARDAKIKLTSLQSNYLKMRGVSDESVQRMSNEGTLDDHVLVMRLHKGAQDDIRRVRDAFVRLEENDPIAYNRMKDRIEQNYKVLTKLQQVAQKNLPKGSQEKVDIYINQLAELTELEVLQAQILQSNEGLRLTKKIVIKPLYQDIQRNKEYIHNANIQLLKEIREGIEERGVGQFGNRVNPQTGKVEKINRNEINEFIDFATEANRQIAGRIEDSANHIAYLLDVQNVARGVAPDKAIISIENLLHPKSLRTRIKRGDVDYNDRQRTVIMDTHKQDRDIVNRMYNYKLKGDDGGESFLDLELDTATLREHIERMLTTTTDNDSINLITNFSNTRLKTVNVKGIARQLTEEGLKELDGDDLINILEEADTLLKIAPIDYGELLTKSGKDALRKKILQPKYMNVLVEEGIGTKFNPQTGEVEKLVLPSKISIGHLKDLMSKLGKDHADNIGTPKGYAAMSLWQKLDEMVNPVLVEGKVTAPEFKRQMDLQTDPTRFQKLAFQYGATKDFFRNEFVPLWKEGIGERLLVSTGKRGSIPNESIFKQFFHDADAIEANAQSFRRMLFKLEEVKDGLGSGSIPRDNAQDLLDFFKYGLYQRVNSGKMTAAEVEKILVAYGGKAGKEDNILLRADPQLQNKLEEYQELITREYQVSDKFVQPEVNRIAQSIKSLRGARESALRESGFNSIANTKNPNELFTNQNIIVKRHELSGEELQRFDELSAEIQKGEKGVFGASADEAAKELDILKGKTVYRSPWATGEPTNQISMTGFEYVRMMTNNFTLVGRKGEKIGENLKESFRLLFYQDIVRSSVKHTGRKTLMNEQYIDELGEIRMGPPIMEEIIDWPEFMRKMEDTRELRKKLFAPETNEALEEILFNEKILSESTANLMGVSGLPTPFRIASWMARGFAIARGVLSVRYVAGETTLQAMRLGYVRMMKKLLVDPDGPIILKNMLPDVEQIAADITLRKLNYKQGIVALASFIGVNASELAFINESEYEHLINKGRFRRETIEAAAKRGHEKHRQEYLKQVKFRKRQPLNLPVGVKQLIPLMNINIEATKTAKGIAGEMWKLFNK
jgi:hypothetical protein